MSDSPLESFVEGIEEAQNKPVGHRLAKAALAAVGAVVASYLIEKVYDRALDSKNEDDVEDTPDSQE